jgi:hypothetical protein
MDGIFTPKDNMNIRINNNQSISNACCLASLRAVQINLTLGSTWSWTYIFKYTVSRNMDIVPPRLRAALSGCPDRHMDRSWCW